MMVRHFHVRHFQSTTTHYRLSQLIGRHRLSCPNLEEETGKVDIDYVS